MPHLTSVGPVADVPEFISFDGPDGAIGALRWSGLPGAPTVVAIHGITANAWHWDPLAHRLGGAATVVAVDLRGRGRSVDHAGPFGMRSHATDIAAVVNALGGDPAVLVGHSMGTYVALMTAELFPELVGDLVLVDGGSSLNVPDDVDVDAALDATLGPAIERLRKVWPGRAEYGAMWEQHPAFAAGMTIDLQRNMLADLVPDGTGFRTAVNEQAVRHDGRELLADPEVGGLLAGRREPTIVIRAPFGLDGAPPPLISDEAVAALPQHRWIQAEGHNHYTVLLFPDGADLVASTVRSVLGIGG